MVRISICLVWMLLFFSANWAAGESQKGRQLSDNSLPSCREIPLPSPAVELPRESPPAGPYVRLSVFDLDLNLGQGHLRPADEARHVWDWYLRANFPLFSEPGGELLGWVANGWRVDIDGRRSELGTAGMLETGYETPSFLVLQARADGWLQVRIAPPGTPHDLIWVQRCHLERASFPLQFETWEALFRRVEVPFFYRRAVPHNLRTAPDSTAEILHRIPAQDHRYQLDLLAIDGNWMQVRVTEPPIFCGGEEQPQRTYQGWIRWRDDRVGPWLWYPTRGC